MRALIEGYQVLFRTIRRKTQQQNRSDSPVCQVANADSSPVILIMIMLKFLCLVPILLRTNPFTRYWDWWQVSDGHPSGIEPVTSSLRDQPRNHKT